MKPTLLPVPILDQDNTDTCVLIVPRKCALICPNMTKITQKKKKNFLVTAQKKGCEDVACDSVITHRCPSDSVLVYNDSISHYECCQRNFECQCDLSLCKVPRCAPGHAPSLLRKSYNKPGFCCDLYQCKVSGKPIYV